MVYDDDDDDDIDEVVADLSALCVTPPPLFPPHTVSR